MEKIMAIQYLRVMRRIVVEIYEIVAIYEPDQLKRHAAEISNLKKWLTYLAKACSMLPQATKNAIKQSHYAVDFDLYKSMAESLTDPNQSGDNVDIMYQECIRLVRDAPKIMSIFFPFWPDITLMVDSCEIFDDPDLKLEHPVLMELDSHLPKVKTDENESENQAFLIEEEGNIPPKGDFYYTDESGKLIIPWLQEDSIEYHNMMSETQKKELIREELRCRAAYPTCKMYLSTRRNILWYVLFNKE